MNPPNRSNRLLRRQLIGNGIALGLGAYIAPIGEGRAAGASSRIAFEMGPGGHLYVEAAILGKRAVAMLDSGTVSNSIDAGFAKELGLRPTSEARAAGMTADVAAQWVDLPEVSVGGRSRPPTAAMAIDLSAISASMSHRVYLVLGQDFFRDVALDIDFTNKVLEFRPATADLGSGFTEEKLRISPHGRLYVPVSVEGKPPVEAMYDLESNAAVTASPAFAAAQGLLQDRPVSKVASVGAEGLSVSSIATLSSIVVAGRVLRQAPVEVPAQWNQTAPLIVGSPVWRRFRNILDLPHSRLGLKPNASGFDAPFTKDRSGIGALRLEDRLRVIFVAPGSPAEAVGLVIGDEVISIDGVRVGPKFYASRPRPGAEPAGVVERLTLSSGRGVDLRLRDYF